jgi:hypothetical protein
MFRNHPLYSRKPNALQLILYTDEIEICNPLGSYTRANKLLMVYYSLGNIDPKFRSKLAAIRLLAIAKAEYGLEKGVRTPTSLLGPGHSSCKSLVPSEILA